jgi:transcriptional regulator with XRE-family HTH domain
VYSLKIGDRIKQRRLELGYSVDELAKLIGKNRATVYRYENNEIENYPTSILEPLANVLETTPAHLMGWVDRDNNNLSDAKHVAEPSGVYGISDQRIYDLAAHGVGHNENLTDEEREDVKLAIQIALAKHKKDR